MRLLYIVPILSLAACGGTSVSLPTPTPTPTPTQAAPAPAVITSQTTATTTPPPVATVTNVPLQIAPVAAQTPQVVTAVPQQQTPAPAPAATPDASFASLLNNVRIASGAGNVAYDARLDAAAQDYAEEMLAQGRFDHRGADGSTPGSRATAAGYRWNYVAENIARGQQTETQVLNAWQGSAGHRRNNLDPRAEDFGFGVAGSGGQKYWVLMFGRER